MNNRILLNIRHQCILFYLNAIYPAILKNRARKVGKKDKIEVVFFAMNVAMWRYQGVYDLLSKDNRFNCHIVFTVPKTFTKEQQAADLKQMREYFGSKGIEYIDHEEGAGYDVKNKINPDILFYPQPYEDIFSKNHDFSLFKSKLLCYIPYSVNVAFHNYWTSDLVFHNLAWKVYCASSMEQRNAAEVAKNHACNWIVSGYSNLDKYCNNDFHDVWKVKDRSLKRLIWAPHFTIAQVSWFQARSNFLWMAQLMLDIAEQKKDVLQIAFKPHPRLKSELYRHPDWGKEKTDEYYQCWGDMVNTQLETGDFVDLFKTSDAMIHDSGSFTAEYLYVNKPVAFVTDNIEQLKIPHSDFGRAALDQHYILKDKDDVLAFINDVVLGGNDSKKEQRTRFFETVLRPDVTGTTSQFIVNDIKKSLGL